MDNVHIVSSVRSEKCCKKIKQITKKKNKKKNTPYLVACAEFIFLQVSIAELHLPFCSNFLCRLFYKFWKSHKNCMCTQGFISSVKNPVKKTISRKLSA